MTRKEKQIIINNVLTHYSIEEEKFEIYVNNKTEENKKDYDRARYKHMSVEILATNLGINIFNGIVDGASKDYMETMKRI